MCDYCLDANVGPHADLEANNLAEIMRKTFLGKLGLEVRIDRKEMLKVFLIANGETNEVLGTKINYCPMCGRKLWN